MNSLLSMAEPVQCLSGIGLELDNLLFADGDSANVSVLPDESVKPVSSSLRPPMAQTDVTGLSASTLSTLTSFFPWPRCKRPWYQVRHGEARHYCNLARSHQHFRSMNILQSC